MNNLLKVITRRPSGAAGIRTCEQQSEADALTTRPPRPTIINHNRSLMIASIILHAVHINEIGLYMEGRVLSPF